MLLEQVTKQLCQEIINRKCAHCKNEVVEFCVVEQTTKKTFINEHLLKVLVRNGDKDKTIFFILKIPSKENQSEFQNERYLYSILPAEQNICPSSFYCINDMLILDDLQNYGYKNGKEVNFDEAHLKVALRKIAEFHSTLNNTNSIQPNSTNSLERFKNLHQQLIDETNTNLQLKTLKRNDFDERLEILFKRMLENLTPSNDFINVVNHGDLRKENLWFAYENDVPVDCKLTNCYFNHYAPPGNDVLFLLLNSTTEKQRKNHFREYLEYYFKCFVENIKTVDWDEFYLTCKVLLPTSKLKSTYFAQDRIRYLTKLEDMITNQLLSEEDCFEILNNELNSTDYTLQNFRVLGFDERLGFLGDHYTLKTKIQFPCGKEQSLSFFVKSISSTPSQREFILANGATFKEHRMFTQFIPLLAKYHIFNEVTPKTLFSRLNDVIVQEDLREQGFVNLDRRVSLVFDEIKVALKALARFHAAFIVLEEKISMERGYKYRLNQEYQKEFKEIFFTREKPVIAEGLDACKTGTRASVDVFYVEENNKIDRNTLYKLFEDTIDKQVQIVKPSEFFRNTVSHGDLWVNNILFKYNKNSVEQCRIIDFQSYRYHPPAHDVLCVLYLTTDREFRQKYFNAALDVYFDELSKTFAQYSLPNLITRKEFDDSCRFYKESVMMQTMTHYHFILIPNDISKYLFENPKELKHFLFKTKYELLKEIFAKDANFRRRNEEIFLDMVEHFESLGVSQ